MRRLFIIAVILALLASALGYEEPALQQLIERANAAAPKDQPGLYIEIAERQLKAADALYVAGKVDQARSAVGDVVTYSEKAHDVAIQTDRRLKNTELASRRMSHRLRDIKRTLNFEDQPPVAAAADRLQSLADDLLAHMFGKGK
jgi:hypothetical protein